MHWFWSEYFWLPNTTRWSDLSNGVEKNMVYPELVALWSLLPLTTGILVSRYILEKHCFAPLGRWLKIHDGRKRSAPSNPILEAVYINSSTYADSVSLAKQLDMTERQVERWWRLRRSQDKPSTLVKFCESLFRLAYYFFIVSFGLYALWDKEWLWDINKSFSGYPYQSLSSDIWWYYMISLSFYCALTVSQFWDVRRKDFWQMFTHHIVTIALLFSSWVSNTHRIGSLVLLLHDSADVAMELAKVAKYAGRGDVMALFVVFTLLWVVTRLIWFPFYIMPVVFAQVNISPLLFTLYLLLCGLLLLHLFWTWLIFEVAYITATSGKEPDDIRSSSSEKE